MNIEQQRKEYERQHRNYERRIRPLFLNVLRSQVDTVVNWINLTDSYDSLPLDEILSSSVFVRPLVNAYQMVGITSARREYYYQRRVQPKNIDVLIDTWRRFLIDFAQNYAYRIQNELNETTKEHIREALAHGYREGYSASKMIIYMRKKVGGQISRFRATLIARTEATTASNIAKEQGAKAYFDEIGETGYQQWISRLDDRTRHDHYVLDGKIIPMGQQWEVGDELADMPGDTRLSAAQRIQCRCVRTFISESLYNRRLTRGEI